MGRAPTPLEIQALLLSLRVAAVAVAVALPAGVCVAWILARFEFPGKTLVDGIVHLPMVVPPVAVGYGLLLVLGRSGPLGGLLERAGITLAFDWKGAAVAAAVMGFPLLVRSVRLSMESVDRGLESAARTLGARPARVFFTVTLPLVTPGILTGIILAFARSLGEFGATITFVSNIPGETRTLPLAIYGFTQTPGGEIGALRLCVIAVAVSLAALVISEVASRRLAARMGG